MSGLKAIKSKIHSVNKTRKVTKAMEAVSAVKMRKSQERALAGRPYARTALTILKRVAGSLDAIQSDLAQERPEVKKVCLVVVSSDKGLCGALNSSVFKQAHALIKEKGWNKEQLAIYAIGKKGQEHFKVREFSEYAFYPSPEESAGLDDIEEITEEVVAGYLDEQYDEVYMIYTNFESTFEQRAVTRKVLPVQFDALETMVAGIVPDKGKFSDVQDKEAKTDVYTIEPDAETVFTTLIPRLVAIELYHGLIEASASEHSARMVAMKNATDKAGEVSKELNLKFNKARQAAITQEVSEIVGGMQVSS